MKCTLGRSTDKLVDNDGKGADGKVEASGGSRQSPPPYQQRVATSHSSLTRSVDPITPAAEPDSVSEVEAKHICTTTALPTEHLPNIDGYSHTDAASRLVNPATDQLNAKGPPPPYSE
ncbi:hypothetical protein IWQ60_006677 [Tieghemiomyces parasiticus]|uniref:Uncharacterized protein n=1 Tax=Tieghemiomyces parasiticus TaxID=78921 RepID=A0A9W8DX12_9FUNG|nr:hypothetical protein IWQ60_006677 [Tieghemiomyces parasiticus]